MATIHFSSDLHLFHENIIHYCDRPFEDALKMNEALRTWHNELVKPSDHWYCTGDVTILRGSAGSKNAKLFIEELKKWNGHKRLLLGNHDHFPVKVYQEAGFEKIVGTGRWFGNFILSHYPIHPNSIGSAEAVVHGHIHNHEVCDPHVIDFPDGQRLVKPYINLCVEVNEYRPITLEQVIAKIKKAKEGYLNVETTNNNIS